MFEQMPGQCFFNQYCIHLLMKPVRADLLLCVDSIILWKTCCSVVDSIWNGTISYTHAMPMYIHMHCGIVTFKVQPLLEWPLPMKEWNVVWLTTCSPRHEFWPPWGLSVSVLSCSNISSNFFPGLFVKAETYFVDRSSHPGFRSWN